MFNSRHDGDWSRLFDSPRLLELSQLTFICYNDFRPNLVPPLAISPNLINLVALRLYFLIDGHDALTRLSQSEFLTGLQTFALDSSNAGKSAARAFAQSQVWDRLRSCSVRGSQIGDAGLSELANGRTRFCLEQLDISHGQYTDTGLMELAKSDRFPNLRELRIGYSTIRDGETASFGARGIEALLRSPNGENLRLGVAILSTDPLPSEIQEIANAHPGRVTIDYEEMTPFR
jgi:hypothetical protein